MPPRRHCELRVCLERLTDEPVVGVWCDACALPSAIALDVVMTLNERPYSVIRVARCVDCGKVTHG